MTTNATYPPLTIDTLAVAIAAQHYSHILFRATSDQRDAADVARVIARNAAELPNYSATTHDAYFAECLLSYVADDLHDFAHNANHADYAPLFNVDPDDDQLFRLFDSEIVADRVTTILLPIIRAAYLESM